MCGITASIRLPPATEAAGTATEGATSRGRSGGASRKPKLAYELRESVAKLRHRGPDAEGIWVSADGGVGLGHARLSIVDLRPEGDQPLHSDAGRGRVHAVVNGEIYDHDAIRERLSREHGCVFRGCSDSEVVVALYQVHGAPAFLEHMRGEFAFVIYDERVEGKARVIAGRDRFGIKPLFWTVLEEDERARRLLFASEAKGLLPFGWQPEWDVPGIMSGAALQADNTLFKNVRKILPGFWMDVDARGAITHRRYWDLSYKNKTELETRSIEEMIAGVREHVVDSVRLRLRADVPVGIYLSGGIDSSAVAGIVTHLTREKGVRMGSKDPTDSISCFTIQFPSSSGFDESDIAERTATWLGVHIDKITMDEATLAANFADSAYHIEHHHWDLNSVGKFALSTLPRRDGVPVVLTGEGSDEHFAGYPWVQPEFFREQDAAMPQQPLSRDESLREGMLAALEETMRSNMAQRGFPMARVFSISNLPSPAELARMTPRSVFNGPWSRMYASWVLDACGEQGLARIWGAVHAVPEDSRDKMCAAGEWHSLHSALYRFIKGPLANVLLTCLGDRTEMAHSIEARPPFLDHKLSEYVNGLPPSVKVSFAPRRRPKKDIQDGLALEVSRPKGPQPNFWDAVAEAARERRMLNQQDGVTNVADDDNDDDDEEGWDLSEKWILREACRPFITQELYERRKHPYTAPLRWPKNGPLQNMLRELVTEEAVNRVGFLHWPSVKEALETAFGTGEDGDEEEGDLMAFRMLLAIGAWVVISQRFGVKTASPADWGTRSEDCG